MNELITLNLTLKELQQIDKYVEINDDTLSVIMKITNAYPPQKSPAEEAFKRVYCRYPDKYGSAWDIFEKGYEAAQKDYKVGEYEPTSQEPEENKWKTVALRFGETLSSIGPCGYYEMTADEWLEWANDTYEKNADELLPLVKRGIRKNEVKEHQPTPPEPTSTVFRQKLFDGIKSVFYDPDYERTHWKMKVDMAVDEVLTHFYDVIPKSQEPVYGDFDEGWDSCLKCIEMRMEFSDD